MKTDTAKVSVSLSSLWNRHRGEVALTSPSLTWLSLFVIVPTVLIVLISFRTPDLSGGVGEGWTLQNWTCWLRPDVHRLAWTTLGLSGLTTLLCVTASVPIAWAMAQLSSSWKRALLLLVIIPFWTNFLIRVFAWKILLNHDGLFTRIARGLGFLNDQDSLLYNSGSVLLVLVYTHLPFAILPIYAAAEKFDFSLLDAARDLGASASRSFFLVFLPGVRTGLAAAAIMVFVPVLGSYLIPELVGGHQSDMLGNRISQRALSDRNLPEASALASGITLAVVSVSVVIWAFQNRTRRIGAQ